MSTSSDLTGKTALITGAARRLGAVTARTLHAAGANIVLHYRSSATEAQAIQSALNAQRAESCQLLHGDLMQFAQLPALVAQAAACYGRLDVLINNASTFYPTPLATVTEAQFDDLLGTNLKVPLFLAQAAAPYLQEQHGCIVNMVDIHSFRPLKNYPAYCAAKAGLWMLTQSLARELAPQVRVNAVAPGAIMYPDSPVNQYLHEELIARTALKREGSPEDVAKAILFLVRDAPYITGQVIPVDGGRMLNH